MAKPGKTNRSKAAKKGAATRKEREARQSGEELKEATEGALGAAKRLGKAAGKSAKKATEATSKRADAE